MVTVNKHYQYFNGELTSEYEVFCLSTDSKPTEGIPNGASLIEINTGKFYLFNAAASSWVYQCSLQGE